MPKLGMGPIRREQICRAAAKVISEHGLAGTTMRMVAEEAGVSTGMLNHHFSNRMEMLEETLVFVSKRQQAREVAAIDGIEPGERRLRAFVRSNLPTNQETKEAWRVWIAAYSAAGTMRQLRRVMAARNELAFQIVERALEGIVSRNPADRISYASQLDALMTGLLWQRIATDADISYADIEEAVIEAALAHASHTSRSNGKRSRAAAKPRARRTTTA
jgi:TetR/AcrR family transcriptional repressor of bet genes